MPATFTIQEKELYNAVKKIDVLFGDIVSKRQRKAMLRKGAKIVREAARANIHDSDKPHYRYRTSKLSGSKRAPKGKGQIVATYYPGNLRDGIQIKSFRKSYDLFVGPVTRSAATASVFGVETAGQKSNVDAYYAHWVEFRNPESKSHGYMRRGVQSSKNIAIKQIVADAKRLFERTIKKISQKRS